MSYYQVPMAPYPATPYLPQPIAAYPPCGYPVPAYAAYPPAVVPPAYPSVYPGGYPYALNPSYPQAYPSPYYQQHALAQQQQQQQHQQHQQQHQQHQQHSVSAPAPAYPTTSVYGAHQPHHPSGSGGGVASAPGTPGGVVVTAPAPAAVSVSSTALQVDRQGLPIVPGDPPLHLPATYRLEERVLSMSRDAFTVRDQQGAVAYRVEPVALVSLHERKALKDAHGRVLLHLRESRLKMRDQITISNAAGVALLTLQKTSAFQLGTKRVHGYLGGHPSGAPVLVITGNSNNTHFRVANAQQEEIADIRRKKFSIKNVLTDQDTYEVIIQKGSPALVCFITVALDEIYED